VDLNGVEAVLRPSTRAELPRFAGGDSFLGGGTWLFSEPQPALRRLVDLSALGWKSLRRTETALHVAATCTFAELEAFQAPIDWIAVGLISSCCHALLGSFKIRGVATVGGNLCLGLAAGPMVALATALDGTCVIWGADGGDRLLNAAEFVTGPGQTALRPGEVLREIVLPAAAFRRRTAFRQVSLTTFGRSAALLIGGRDATDFTLTITAATPHPVRVTFDRFPESAALAARIDAEVSAWYDDIHGAPDWRRNLTLLLAEEIRLELAAP
jgi:CO/xanthine dehydrogenase FAD-binding subunit